MKKKMSIMLKERRTSHFLEKKYYIQFIIFSKNILQFKIPFKFLRIYGGKKIKF